MNVKKYQLEQQEVNYNTTKEQILEKVKNEIERCPYIYNCKINNSPFYPFIYNDTKRHYKRLVEDLKKDGIHLEYVKEIERVTKGFFKKRTEEMVKSEYYLLSWD